jgi:hypothetical protein
MEREIELAGIGALGGLLKRLPKGQAHTLPPGSACPNCDATLEGPYCHQCGQLAENYHRSIGHLVEELFESLFHLDGRLWRTLPGLVARPGRLTRDYLDGHRAFQIPPLRMFLIALLLVFLFGGMDRGHTKLVAARPGGNVRVIDLRNDPQAQQKLNIDLGPTAHDKARASWLKSRVIAASRDPERFAMVMESWAHRLAILMLPIGAGLLALMYAFQRRFFIYDHLIFTMHSLSFQGLLLSLYFLVKLALPPLAAVLLLAAPVHLFVHMRGVYGSSILGTLLRMTVLFLGSMVAFVAIMTALVFIGLAAMAPG